VLNLGHYKTTAQFFDADSRGSAAEKYLMEPIGVHLNRLHELEHGVRVAMPQS